MAASSMTANGFELELYTDKLERFKKQYRSYFGAECDLSDESILGMLVAIKAETLQESELLIQCLAASLDPDQAIGVFLDFVCSFSGTARLEALPSTARVSFRGEPNTQILNAPTTKQVAISAGGYVFNLDDGIIIDPAASVECFYKVESIADTTAYTLTVNAVSFSYTSDGSATELEILTGLRNAVNAGSLAATAELSGAYLRIFSDDLITTLAFTVTTNNLSIFQLGTLGAVSCTVAAPIIVLTGAIDSIITPVSGLKSVTNLSAGITGRYREDDDALRVRRSENVQVSTSGTDKGIKKALQQNVDGVTFAKVISNREDTTDGYGIPAHRFSCIVQGGTDADVVSEIFNRQPAGVKSYGNTSGTTIDEEGQTQTIYFSRPVPRYVWVNITVEADSTFPTTGADLVAEAIAAEGAALFGIGDEGKVQQLFDAAFSVTGVDRITVFETATKLTTTPDPAPGDYSTSNITVAVDEILDFAVARVTVTVV